MNARSAAASATSVLAALGLLACGGGGGHASTPPADQATRLVPADALLYVHVSTDTGRPATADAAKLAARFPGFAAARDGLLKRLSAPGCRITPGRGREVALALVPTAGSTAGSLVIVDTGDEKPFADRICGQVRVAKLGRMLVLGQPATLAKARALARKDGAGSLSTSAAYREATAALPADRVADAWATSAGVRRLLAPQPGLLGIAGTLVDQPNLKSVAASLGADASTAARLVLRSQLTRRTVSRGFTPTLQDVVPAGALAYLDVAGLSGAAQRLLPLLGGSSAQLGPLLARAGADLAPLSRLFARESAILLMPATPAPILSIVTRTGDEAAAARALARSRPLVARLLAPASGQTPVWQQRAGVWRLRPARGIEIDYAVFDGKVAVATRPAAITALRRLSEPLGKARAFREVQADLGKRSTSVGFMDFIQLLRLGEQTGLNDDRAFLAAKHDLRKLASVGARTTGDGDVTTAELHLSIP